MRSLRVTAIQRGCVYDGRGVRTTIFLKGCSLHCPWCCNPETLSGYPDFFVDRKKCLRTRGIKADFCINCELTNGSISVLQCPLGVGERTVKAYSVIELFELIKKDISLFETTGGGVTFSGGEPLLQVRNLLPLLQRLFDEQIDIAFETTLVMPKKNLQLVLPFSNEFLVDLKLQPEMNLNDLAYLSKIKPLYQLLKGKRLVTRLVFIDSLLEQKDKVATALRFLGVTSVELLQCHGLGAKKYEKLLLPMPAYTASDDSMNVFSNFLQSEGIGSTTLKL